MVGGRWLTAAALKAAQNNPHANKPERVLVRMMDGKDANVHLRQDGTACAVDITKMTPSAAATAVYDLYQEAREIALAKVSDADRTSRSMYVSVFGAGERQLGMLGGSFVITAENDKEKVTGSLRLRDILRQQDPEPGISAEKTVAKTLDLKPATV